MRSRTGEIIKVRVPGVARCPYRADRLRPVRDLEWGMPGNFYGTTASFAEVDASVTRPDGRPARRFSFRIRPSKSELVVNAGFVPISTLLSAGHAALTPRAGRFQEEIPTGLSSHFSPRSILPVRFVRVGGHRSNDADCRIVQNSVSRGSGRTPGHLRGGNGQKIFY